MENSHDKEQVLQNNYENNKNKISSLQINSNWSVENEKNLQECVSTISKDENIECIDLQDVVSFDTCVNLKSKSNEHCKINLQIKNTQKICRIVIVSEASVLEFYKQSGEYDSTVHAEFVDEYEGSAVYIADTNFAYPSSEICIKFIRTKTRNSMWIYGIKLILSNLVLEPLKHTFNVDIVEDILTEVSKDKPDRIAMAKKVLKSFNASENNFHDDNISTCIFSTMKKTFQENLRLEKVSDLSKIKKDNLVNNGHTKEDNLDLKLYIDEKFSKLEKKMTEKIEAAEEKINNKLDKILNLLEKK